MPEQRVQDHSAVGLIAVKILRHAEKHQLDQGERERGVAPKRKADHAVKEDERASRRLNRPALSLAPDGGDGVRYLPTRAERSVLDSRSP